MSVLTCQRNRGKWMKTIWMFVGAFCFATAFSAQSSSPHPTVPLLQSAALPSYPDVWRAGRITGKVVASVTVKDGRVIRVEKTAGNSHLFDTTRKSIESWKFHSGSDAVFTVTFTYVIAGEESEEPMRPQVEMASNFGCSSHRTTLPWQLVCAHPSPTNRK